MPNQLESLFQELKKSRVRFCVRGRYQHLPKTLDGGDVDLLFQKDQFPKALKVLKKFHFYHYPHTRPNLFFYLHDPELGLIQLDILLCKKLPPIKPFKSFYIPADEKPIPNRKRLHQKIHSKTLRSARWAFKGPVIAFEGPDGSGKTTASKALLDSLDKLPLKKEFIHFATPFNKDGSKPSALKRLSTRLGAIAKVYKNKALGRVSITDRYIYLTFRKKHPALKKTLRALAPTPDLLFITKTSPKIIQKRKKGQRDFLQAKEISELYSVYENAPAKLKIPINTSKKSHKEHSKTVNNFLKNILLPINP